jgi:hypothetical protein
VETLKSGLSTMNRTVAEHIRDLEEKRNLLSGRMMEERDKAKCNQIEAELRAVESALTLFRSALEIEARVS